MKIASQAELKQLDQAAIEELKIPAMVLMENAAREVLDRLDLRKSYFVIICGCGNNGGDGLALARQLSVRGKEVDVYVLGDPRRASLEVQRNLAICQNLKVNVVFLNEEADLWDLREAINDADCVIDAIFGIGLSRPVEGIYKEVIENINDFSRHTVSIDIPSGIATDTGEVLGCAVNAHETITFSCYKKGFLNYKTLECLGKVKVASIGIPRELVEAIGGHEYLVEHDMVQGLIPLRAKTGHKGDYGRILIVAGSPGFTGANKISSEACIATGAGLVTVSSDARVINLLSENVREAMTIHPDQIEDAVENCNVIAFGPGMGNNKETLLLLIRIIKKLRKEGKSDTTLILDADGINVLAGRADLLENIGVRVILTPHFGEMARLCGQSVEVVRDQRMEMAREFARQHKITLVLKGHNTVVTDGVSIFVNPTGSSAIASGGMGDCLTGIVAGLAGQGLSPMEACIAGTYLHGYIGDELAKTRYSVPASEIIAHIPFEMKRMVQKDHGRKNNEGER